MLSYAKYDSYTSIQNVSARNLTMRGGSTRMFGVIPIDFSSFS